MCINFFNGVNDGYHADWQWTPMQVGDLPRADIAPEDNVLFVCKLNPVTTEEDLEIIFSRFGKILR